MVRPGGTLLGALLFLSTAIPALGTAAVVTTKVTGTATYRERIALSPDAVFEATLEDISRAGAPAVIVARTRSEKPGQVPIAFELSCDARRIEPSKTYGVRATIYEAGRLRFSSDQAQLVLTQGHGNQVAVVLRAQGGDDHDEPVGAGGAAVLGALPATFTGLLPCPDCAGLRYQINLLPGDVYMQRMTHLRDGQDVSGYEFGACSTSAEGRTITLQSTRRLTRWAITDPQTLGKLDPNGRVVGELKRSDTVEPMSPRVTLRGMFRYMADAARFRDCDTDLEWPVAMSDDYKALERAYTSRPMAGAELLVSVKGRIESMPRVEGKGNEPTLVVEKFVSATPTQSCAIRAAVLGLENNRWRPITIGEQTVTVSGPKREPWIHLDPKTMTVTGSGGCNRISGSYQTGPDRLQFGALVSTRMACVAMETESAFLRALGRTRSYRIKGRTLELMDEKQLVLARLEERNLR